MSFDVKCFKNRENEFGRVTRYVELITERRYDKEKKQSRNKRVCIGIDISHIYPGMMIINEKYHDYFNKNGDLIFSPRIEVREEKKKTKEKKEQNQDQSQDRQNSDKSKSQEEQEKAERARQEKLKEDLEQQKEDLKDTHSSSSYDYEYIDAGDAQGYGEGTLW